MSTARIKLRCNEDSNVLVHEHVTSVGAAAREEEESCIDAATVRGYRLLVMCQEVRDEIEAVLGADTDAAELLRAMCDHRLVATPWLNQARSSCTLHPPRPMHA